MGWRCSPPFYQCCRGNRDHQLIHQLHKGVGYVAETAGLVHHAWCSAARYTLQEVLPGKGHAYVRAAQQLVGGTAVSQRKRWLCGPTVGRTSCCSCSSRGSGLCRSLSTFEPGLMERRSLACWGSMPGRVAVLCSNLYATDRVSIRCMSDCQLECSFPLMW